MPESMTIGQWLLMQQMGKQMEQGQAVGKQSAAESGTGPGSGVNTDQVNQLNTQSSIEPASIQPTDPSYLQGTNYTGSPADTNPLTFGQYQNPFTQGNVTFQGQDFNPNATGLNAPNIPAGSGSDSPTFSTPLSGGNPSGFETMPFDMWNQIYGQTPRDNQTPTTTATNPNFSVDPSGAGLVPSTMNYPDGKGGFTQLPTDPLGQTSTVPLIGENPFTTDPSSGISSSGLPIGSFRPDAVASGIPLPGATFNLGASGGSLGEFGNMNAAMILRHIAKFGQTPTWGTWTPQDVAHWQNVLSQSPTTPTKSGPQGSIGLPMTGQGVPTGGNR